MPRPVRTAAQRAKELIAAGLTVEQVDAVGAPGMTSREEEEIYEEMTCGMTYDLVSKSTSKKARTGRKGRGAMRNVSRFRSYEDVDEEPPRVKFRPKRLPGLHLSDMLTRQTAHNFSREIDFFNLFMTDEFRETVVDNTNLYAWLNIHQKRSYARRDGSWEETSIQELRHLIAVLIFHGFAGRKDIDRNWSQATLYSGGWSRRFLSKNRFKALSGVLHISKPGAEDTTDKLAKIRPMLQHMREVCGKYYQPLQAVSIDERMVRSKGWSPVQQYVPSKPTPYGYKLWCMCDPVTGYTFDFSVYTGKDTERSSNGLGYDVVTSLIAPHLNQGYQVFTDNFFSSHHLAKDLLQQDTLVCGTMQPWRRGFPSVLKEKNWPKKAKRGDLRYIRDDGAMYLQWFDKRVVNMISTIHRGNDHVLLLRHGKGSDGKYEPSVVRIPSCVHSYNKHIGGVDLADQMLESYNLLVKTTRWWKTLFFHLVDLAVLNSYILFSQWRNANPQIAGLSRRAGYTHLDFREELVRQLARIRYDEGVPIYTPMLRRKRSLNCTGPHDPIVTTTGRNCRVCYLLHGKQNKSYVKCSDPQCDTHLCLNRSQNCFPKWHSSNFDCFRYKVAKKSEE